MVKPRILHMRTRINLRGDGREWFPLVIATIAKHSAFPHYCLLSRKRTEKDWEGRKGKALKCRRINHSMSVAYCSPTSFWTRHGRQEGKEHKMGIKTYKAPPRKRCKRENHNPEWVCKLYPMRNVLWEQQLLVMGKQLHRQLCSFPPHLLSLVLVSLPVGVLNTHHGCKLPQSSP